MTDSVNSRELVLAILLAVTKDGIYSHVAISDVLTKYQYLEKQERSFITRVSEGTLERMLELDYIINQFSSVKVNKMKPVIRCIIRSAVYEMNKSGIGFLQRSSKACKEKRLWKAFRICQWSASEYRKKS